ncbi:CFA54-like protein [Mya arenaria]|uniref:CFA54-like protein n=1 Tax=Mya arenaria TaxID=6604 RepID=A0ABY7G0W1_MYAAR|nr:CFA54-like protein [Mya arenaria]
MFLNFTLSFSSRSDLDPVVMWTDALGVLMSALELSQASVTREAYLEAELLLNIGKVQRMLAYLEIALVYLYSSGGVTMKEGGIDPGAQSGEDVSPRLASKGTKKKSPRKSKSKTKDDMNEQEKERRAAWLAIRCAAAVSNTQRNRILLIGDTGVTSQKLSDEAQKEMPDFAALDLVGAYVLGEKKKVYKSYQTILQRLSSTSTISASSVQPDDRPTSGERNVGELGPDFDLGFISHAECDTSLNHDVVRTMLFSGTWTTRIARMHSYLSTNLKPYGSDCCAVYPPAGLDLAPTAEKPTELNIVYKSYPDNLTNPADLENETQLKFDIEFLQGMAPAPPGSERNPVKPADKPITTPPDNEVTLQWYQPSLEEVDPLRPEAMGPESRVLLMYALNMKSGGSVNVAVRLMLAVLLQRAEVYLPTGKGKKRGVEPSPTPTVKSRKTKERLRPLSPKRQKDETLETLLRQCIDDITILFGSTAEPDTASSVTEVCVVVCK